MTIQSVDEEHQDTPMSESQIPATSPVHQSQNPLSYKDKLMGEENPAILSFNTIPSYMEEESDVDDDPEDDAPIVLLSRAKKRRIREPWMNAIIIKAFHPKPLGYNYIFPRVQAQWKPNGKWDFIDLSFDFFLVRFQDNEDLSRVIMGGPWFIGPYYLTMRRWEPNFDPEEAIRTTTTTAVWADYYDPTTLQKIGNKVGPLLRVDAHTAHHTRGQYARVCVQIDLAQPAAKYVRIGKKKQKVIYEEMIKEAANPVPLSTHASSSTPPSVKAVTPPSTPNSISQTFDISKSFDKDNYGPWLLVERRRSKRRPLPNSLTVEKIPSNPKAKNGNVLSALNADLSSKQSLTVQKAKAPLVDFSKPEPKTQQWVNKTSNKAQGPPKSITIQEPKSKSKNSPTQALPTHQSIASEPNPGSVTQKLSIPHQDPTISSLISVQPNPITPVHSTSTSTFGINPQTPLSQNSTQPLLNHGSVSNSASRSENPNVSGKGTIDRSDGDSCGVDTGLLIPQGIQMVAESIVHSVESPHSHGHGDEPPRDGSLDPPQPRKI
ncbi:hypothetical protein SLEP1_g31464 [Rubroshorea leprosula]|uniref:DUF4283 domain-containing protein n=1 Tax=Rubroshorea leprosula TaxID=152421 RepID=A0AAV5KAG2_9ROSI|nr:hypothetical protein SLEP1_g31464 [Rubroshorea leprosula]